MQSLTDKCRIAARQIRKDIIDMTYMAGNMGAHLGGSLSMVEILSVLYVGCIKYDIQHPEWEGRDRVILSKGHAALALYPALVQAGIMEREQLGNFKKDGSQIGGHPSLNGMHGIEFASGSLGQGLSLGVGVALALRKKKNKESKIYVLLGDGECDEGSVWEAAASASHYGLNRLVAIIDENGIQYDGDTSEILNMNPGAEKWKSFGWDVCEVDGHNVEQVLDAYNIEHERPMAIIAHTIKGKGISFMEGNWRYHNARLSEKEYRQALDELENAV